MRTGIIERMYRKKAKRNGGVGGSPGDSHSNNTPTPAKADALRRRGGGKARDKKKALEKLANQKPCA